MKKVTIISGSNVSLAKFYNSDYEIVLSTGGEIPTIHIYKLNLETNNYDFDVTKEFSCSGDPHLYGSLETLSIVNQIINLRKKLF